MSAPQPQSGKQAPGPTQGRPGAGETGPRPAGPEAGATEPARPHHAPWSAWHREFLHFLAAAPAWWIGPLLGIGLVLILLRWLGPDVDAEFVYSLF
jgi:hypothetical protein